MDDVLNFIDAQAVVCNVLRITSRIVFAISLDEIEVHRDISRPELLARVC
jgi:hypothetical protein